MIDVEDCGSRVGKRCDCGLTEKWWLCVCVRRVNVVYLLKSDVYPIVDFKNSDL